MRHPYKQIKKRSTWKTKGSRRKIEQVNKKTRNQNVHKLMEDKKKSKTKKVEML
jgi:hypothetical protein